MPLSIRRAEYYRTTMADRPGEAYQLLAKLAGAGVNLLVFNAIPLDSEHTELVVFPDDLEKFTQVADDAGIVLRGPEHAFLIQGDDHLGALADIHVRLAVLVRAHESIRIELGGWKPRWRFIKRVAGVGTPVALQWTALQPSRLVEAIMGVNQAGNVITRLVELRRNVRGFSLAGLHYPGKTQTLAADTPDLYAGGGQRGGAASADQPGGRLGAFINGSYSTGDRDDTVWTNEFDFDTYGLTGGVDYRFTDNLVFGLALSYHDVDADFDEKPTVSGGSVDADGWGGFLYGTWYADRFYVDALAGYAKTDYDTKRDIFIPNNNDPTQNINETAKGSPDSDDYTVGIGAGYTLGSGALSYGPYARLTYYEVDIDDYQEKGAEASGLNLKVDGQDWESLTTVLGAQVSYAISQNFGVIVPQGQVGWVHEFENDSEEFTAVYVDDPRQNELRAETNDPDRDYFEVGLGVSAVFKGGTQAFIYYDTVLGFDDLTDHIVTVGGRMEF